MRFQSSISDWTNLPLFSVEDSFQRSRLKQLKHKKATNKVIAKFPDSEWKKSLFVFNASRPSASASGVTTTKADISKNDFFFHAFWLGKRENKQNFYE